MHLNFDVTNARDRAIFRNYLYESRANMCSGQTLTIVGKIASKTESVGFLALPNVCAQTSKNKRSNA